MPHGCNSLAFAFQEFSGRSDRSAQGGVSGLHRTLDPSLRQHAPAGDDWLYEIKADGYRAQVHVHDGNVTAYSRTGLNWTGQFRDITEAAEQLS